MFQKLFTAQQIKDIDNQTIKRQNITSEELMERAATRLHKALVKDLKIEQTIYIFCGKGNNGGDALVLARLLQPVYHIKCILVPFSKKSSLDFDLNLKKLSEMPLAIETYQSENNLKIGPKDIVIDGIFGTGLTRPATGIAAAAIDYVNRSGATVYSIDMPSGLYADQSNQPDDSIIKATKVYTFQFPKISFLFPENAPYIKDFEIVDIGLDPSVISVMPTQYFMITKNIKNILKERSKVSYKNNFGHALIVGGSFGMMGAPVLASKAALRIGAGLVSNFLPKIGYQISQTAISEVMTHTDKQSKYITKIQVPDKITAVGLGMGFGQHPETQKAFKKFLKKNDKALLLDADALNILALHPEWLHLLPKNTILTPHIGEFKRLVGSWKNDSEKLEKLQKFAEKHQAIVVLKGAYTTISDGAFFYINPVANAALATAGSGDVLSGIITGLLAQGYQPLEAALLGVYLHSQTAELYTQEHQNFSMIASDIITLLKDKDLLLSNKKV